MAKSNSKRSGFIGALGSGCLIVLLLITGAVFAIFILIYFSPSFETIDYHYSINLADKPQQNIHSDFSWNYVDDNLNRYNASLSLTIPEEEVKSALDFIRVLINATDDELGLGSLSGSTDSLLIAREVWFVLYKRILEQGAVQLSGLNAKLDQIFKEAKMSPEQKFLFLTTFIQNINYAIPEDGMGVLPPIVTLAKSYGDCDTKALLLYILLRRQNIDCVFMWSGYYTHAMLGVNIPATGGYKWYEGVKYYFLEVTSPEWAPGQLPPDVSNPDYWFVFDLR